MPQHPITNIIRRYHTKVSPTRQMDLGNSIIRLIADILRWCHQRGYAPTVILKRAAAEAGIKVTTARQ